MSADLKKNYIINEDETEINIKDLLTYCFLHWRKALALMLMAGILLGGLMGGLEGMKTAKLAAAYQEYLDDPQALMAKQQNTIFAQKNGIVLPEDEMLTSEEQRILEEVATVDSINNLNDIITQSRRDLMTLTEYYNNSVLMTVTPQAVPTAEADIMITVPDGAPANAVNVLIAAYEDYLKNGNYLDVFSMEFDLDKTYLKELISITDMTFGNIDESSNQSGNRDITTDVDINFSVTSTSKHQTTLYCTVILPKCQFIIVRISLKNDKKRTRTGNQSGTGADELIMLQTGLYSASSSPMFSSTKSLMQLWICFSL